MVGHINYPLGLASLAILFGFVSFTFCLDSSKDVEGSIYLGTYRSYDKNRKEFTDSDYYVSSGAASWSAAETDCKRRFGDEAGLIWFNTPEELEYVAEMLIDRFPGPLGHWTSGVYVVSRGVWVWATTGEEVPAWVPWNPTPTNPDANSRITLLVYGLYDYVVAEDTFSFVQTYVCKKAESDPEPPVPIIPCYKTLDLELILDSSGSIGSDNFDVALSYLSNLTTAFTVHNESRLGFLTYSTSASRYIPLTNVLTPDQIEQTIHATPYDSGNTNTHLGVDTAVASLTANNRTSIPQAMVILTDGASNDPTATTAAALRAKNLGISMYAIGITNSTNEAELLRLAGGVSDNVFHAFDWADLIPLLTTTSEQICPE